MKLFASFFAACDEGPGLCAHLITFLSILLVFVTIPFSLCFAVKVSEINYLYIYVTNITLLQKITKSLTNGGGGVTFKVKVFSELE